MNKKTSWVIVLICFYLFNSCGENDILNSTGKVSFSASGLPVLPGGYIYQVWLLVGGSYVSIGTFNINDEGISNKEGFEQINNNDLKKAKGAAITIEFTGKESKFSPSDLVVLAGNFTGDKTILNTKDKRTVYAPDLKAEYVVDAPTALKSEKSSSGENGIWFSTDTNQSEQTAGLVLPYIQNDPKKTASNLIYQAWIYANDIEDKTKLIPINIGDFTKADKPDNSNNYAGTNQNFTPILPGNDFINVTGINVKVPIDVLGKKVTITAKPAEEKTVDSSPFPFVLFEKTISSTKGSLDINNKKFKATVTIK